MHVHLLTRPDGSVIVVGLAPKARRDGEPDATFAARVLARTLEANPGWKGFPVVTMERVTVEPMLANRRFRNAWTVTAGVLTHDMGKARALRLTEIRAERDRRLATSDGPMLRTQETGTGPQIAAMTAYRQQLRDVPQAIDLSGIVTPEALAAFEPIWPVSP